MEQYHMKFVKKSHNVDVKRSYSCCFCGHNLHSRVRCFCTLSPMSFFHPTKSFYIFSLKEDSMYTITMP